MRFYFAALVLLYTASASALGRRAPESKAHCPWFSGSPFVSEAGGQSDCTQAAALSAAKLEHEHKAPGKIRCEIVQGCRFSCAREKHRCRRDGAIFPEGFRGVSSCLPVCSREDKLELPPEVKEAATGSDGCPEFAMRKAVGIGDDCPAATADVHAQLAADDFNELAICRAAGCSGKTLEVLRDCKQGQGLVFDETAAAPDVFTRFAAHRTTCRKSPL